MDIETCFFLEQLVGSRGWTRSFDVFSEFLNTHRVFLYPKVCHIHKHASDSALSTLFPYNNS